MASGHVPVSIGAGLATAPVFTETLLGGCAWVGITAVSGLLPDICSASSTITKSLGPITKTISFFVRLFVRHRGLTHSDLGIAIWVLGLAYLCNLAGLPVWLALASGMGCVSHLLADAWTVQGVKPFILFPKVRIQFSDEKAGAGSEPFVAYGAMLAGAVGCAFQVF